MRSLVLFAALMACGDNELPAGVPLGVANDLAIVAHQDDDLLFMQPDLIEALRHGGGVTIAYVTAGNDNHDFAYSQKRYDGVMSAYSAASGASGWQCGWIELSGHAAEHCRLEAAKLSLVFLGYPDGGKQGQFATSLLALWSGKITGADTIAPRTAHYDREGLVATLAAVIATTQPRTIRTLEVAANHGTDHSDHMIVGALAVLAKASAGAQAELLSYRGYDISAEPGDGFPPITAIANDAFAHYSACTDGCAACGEACATFSATYAGYLQRHYAVRIDRYATGVAEGMCVSAGGLGDCAVPWRFDRDGLVHVGDQCVAVDTTGGLGLGPCATATPMTLDEEGHIWIGVPPPAMTDAMHLDCVAMIAGVPRVTLCGGDMAPTWTIAPVTTSTPRAAIALEQAGRAVQLGDVTGDGSVDLCAVVGADLSCAAGDGHGGFTRAVVIAALAIDPESLALGDIDGDGATDACGRDATGIVCATAASGFVAHPVSSIDVEPRSLAVLDGQICGLTTEGMTCATAAGSVLVSPFPSAALSPVDLDGDALPDWCTASANGPVCGRGADRELSTEGVPWAFSLAGVIDATSAGTFGDLDGDRRADVCSIEGTRVACAYSHGTAFGPRSTVMQLVTAPVALWIRGADLCVDTVDDVVCERVFSLGS